MKRYVAGGVPEAAEILAKLSATPHLRLHFEYDENGPDIPTVRYELSQMLIREIEEAEE